MQWVLVLAVYWAATAWLLVQEHFNIGLTSCRSRTVPCNQFGRHRGQKQRTVRGQTTLWQPTTTLQTNVIPPSPHWPPSSLQISHFALHDKAASSFPTKTLLHLCNTLFLDTKPQPDFLTFLAWTSALAAMSSFTDSALLLSTARCRGHSPCILFFVTLALTWPSTIPTLCS